MRALDERPPFFATCNKTFGRWDGNLRTRDGFVLHMAGFQLQELGELAVGDSFHSYPSIRRECLPLLRIMLVKIHSHHV